jgi:hypothetical protein
MGFPWGVEFATWVGAAGTQTHQEIVHITPELDSQNVTSEGWLVKPSRDGRPKLVLDRKAKLSGWLARLSAMGKGNGRFMGTIYVRAEHARNLLVLAYGTGMNAFGGGWEEVLVKITPPVELLILTNTLPNEVLRFERQVIVPSYINEARPEGLFLPIAPDGDPRVPQWVRNPERRRIASTAPA